MSNYLQIHISGLYYPQFYAVPGILSITYEAERAQLESNLLTGDTNQPGHLYILWCLHGMFLQGQTAAQDPVLSQKKKKNF